MDLVKKQLTHDLVKKSVHTLFGKNHLKQDLVNYELTHDMVKKSDSK